MARAKSSLISVGLLLILLPVLAVFQYRWIGEVSAAERERLSSSLRMASDRFAADFDAELSRLANAFQMRDGFPDTAEPLLERYQSWSEGNTYARIVRSIYVLKNVPEKGPEFYKVDFQTREFVPASLPLDFENLRDRFRPGPSALSPYAANRRMMLVTSISRPGRQFGAVRSDEFWQR